MLNNVTHTVLDGQLGLGTVKGTGIHVKIGASPVISSRPITVSGSKGVDSIRQMLGLSPLADAVMDAVENGASRIYCIPVTGGIDGTINEGDKPAGEHTGTVTMKGKPTNEFMVIVEITGQGGLNQAEFRYSLNGGYSYSDELTVPLSGTYSIDTAGVALNFTLEESRSFMVGDRYTWHTTAPRMNIEDVTAAVNKLKDMTNEYEYVHIVGGCSADMWAVISTLQKQLMEKNHKQLFFMLEAYSQEKNESVDSYVERLVADRKKVRNYYIQVVAARAMYLGMDGITRDVNMAGIVSGLYSAVSVHKSIGEVANISLPESRVTQLLPEGLGEEHIEELDGNGYLTFRQYDGLEGFYVTNARMMCPEGSDFRYAEDIRVLNKIIRVTRKEALLQLQTDIDMENQAGDLAAKAAFIQAPLDDMVRDKEISSARVSIPEEQDILATGILQVEIRYVQRGIIRSIAVSVGTENPNA